MTFDELSLTASISIVAPTHVTLVIDPQNPTVPIGGTVDFHARALDAQGLEFFGLPMTWRLVAGGGVLSSTDQFTAGVETGTFPDTIKVESGAWSATTGVIIPEDADGDGLPDGAERRCPGIDTHDPSDADRDFDKDGLTNIQEARMGTCMCDPDFDDDGVPDGQEPKPGEDTDGDGLVNANDPDSDDDGLPDGLELGIRIPTSGTRLDAHVFIADLDPATTTDPLNPDTDGDGIKDGAEDRNHNGRVDPSETDPNVPDCNPACGPTETCNRTTLVCESSDVGAGDGGCSCAGASGAPSVGVLVLLLAMGLLRRTSSVTGPRG